ncbi:MAG TPA: 1,6-anhydro-N-acetylmuramyl-L-alanine amidase AmpD [Pseudomonas xinjiangensis]|uniref:1,6-anhydro-N-acetylmuramyl-L-alanine amidase AmpD n=1 Tax=Halopseudomonas xinjiangensis TaxID=487184 RepID=A0A7V1FS63_9GAMM|nr:1,6-anhydro-N-acetylmuramyl-L-alanine amidase AmpD [Halopseudomonas xinjiangensis]HEC46570.1 1,6-anhydro-N-acetylmuramyl-L-alanine amidase AmpD [Halopseudomonas xinjiangensis]
MHKVADDGWFSGAEVCATSHFNARPPGESISLLVIHNISLPPGQFGGKHVQRFFTGQIDPAGHPYFSEIAHLRVSAHFLIERDGAVTQFVSCLNRAWHAGDSRYARRSDCNDFSIGVELEGTDDEPYSADQYSALVELTCALRKAYPDITPGRITGHEFIAPGRKTDPGPGFDWHHYLRCVTGHAVPGQQESLP